MSRLAGFSYTVRSFGQMDLGVPDTPPTTLSDWTGEAIVAHGRGRMTFVRSSPRRLFSAGDYALFDGDGAIIVKPETRSFALPALLLPARARRVLLAIRDLTWKLSTMKKRETVAGIAATHHRVIASYRMRVEAKADTEAGDDADSREDQMPFTTTTSTHDYWYARVTGLPNNALMPFAPAGPISVEPGAADLSSMWDSIHAQLATNGTALRVRATLRVSVDMADMPHVAETMSSADADEMAEMAGMIRVIENVTTSDSAIADLDHSDVESELLVLPEGFSLEADDGSEEANSGVDIGARWRTFPGG